MASPIYNSNPAPGPSNGLWGSLPGAIAMPNPYGDLRGVFPNLTGLDANASSSLIGHLQGQLSPETLNHLQDTAAQYGVASGMPGSELAQHGYLADVAAASQGLSQKGISEYDYLIPQVKKTQTVAPDWQTQIAEANAISSSTANPFLTGIGNLAAGAAGVTAALPWGKFFANTGPNSGIGSDSELGYASENGSNLGGSGYEGSNDYSGTSTFNVDE